MAEQGAKRRGADHRIHAVTWKRRHGAEFAPLHALAKGNGMDSRVFATELRSCSALE